MESQRIVIVGASARAAAHSAIRAGLTPLCVDLFADADLVSVCECRRVRNWDEVPEAVRSLTRAYGPSPWMYTGALENRPWLIETLTREHRLWGNDAATIARVRSAQVLGQIFHSASVPFPETRDSKVGVPTDGTWLVKPIASAGGRGIARWRGQVITPNREVVFQRLLSGPSVAACYVGDSPRAVLLGVTQQLVGEAWLHAAPFRYCGSIGPLNLGDEERQAFARIGSVLAEEFGLRGLFGVDCVMSGGVPWPVEVNPRYTASVEVIEQVTGVSALALHRAACEGPGLPEVRQSASHQAGKAILFARQPIAFPAAGPWQSSLVAAPSEFRRFADLPCPGTSVPKNAPVMSVMARSGSAEVCLAELKQIVAELDRLLFSQ
jgi:predicted ATP-grasp superfamily ATP-dependent carboligase